MDSLYNWNDATKIGVVLTGLGIFFSFLGIVMLLDSALLTLGNILFVAGVALVMGPARSKSFFLDPRRFRSSICFFFGILLVMWGWCLIGLMVQGFGALNLFGNFFPMVVRVMESMPVIGTVLEHPVAQNLLEKMNLVRRRNV